MNVSLRNNLDGLSPFFAGMVVFGAMSKEPSRNSIPMANLNETNA